MEVSPPFVLAKHPCLCRALSNISGMGMFTIVNAFRLMSFASFDFLKYEYTGGDYKDDYDAREDCPPSPALPTLSPTSAPEPTPTPFESTPSPTLAPSPAPVSDPEEYLGCFADMRGARTMGRGYTDNENMTNEVSLVRKTEEELVGCQEVDSFNRRFNNPAERIPTLVYALKGWHLTQARSMERPY